MQAATDLSKLEEYEHIAELLTYVLDMREHRPPGAQGGSAQLYGVVINDHSFTLSLLELDPDDPVADLWGLTAKPLDLSRGQDQWAWILVACETAQGDELAVSVSAVGETAIELRSTGLSPFRTSNTASGALVDACADIFSSLRADSAS